MGCHDYDWDKLVHYLHRVHGYPKGVLDVCSKSDLTALYCIVPYPTTKEEKRLYKEKHQFGDHQDRCRTIRFVANRVPSTCVEKLTRMKDADLKAQIAEAIKVELTKRPVKKPSKPQPAPECPRKKADQCNKAKPKSEASPAKHAHYRCVRIPCKSATHKAEQPAKSDYSSTSHKRHTCACFEDSDSDNASDVCSEPIATPIARSRSRSRSRRSDDSNSSATQPRSRSLGSYSSSSSRSRSSSPSPEPLPSKSSKRKSSDKKRSDKTDEAVPKPKGDGDRDKDQTTIEAVADDVEVATQESPPAESPPDKSSSSSTSSEPSKDDEAATGGRDDNDDAHDAPESIPDEEHRDSSSPAPAASATSPAASQQKSSVASTPLTAPVGAPPVDDGDEDSPPPSADILSPMGRPAGLSPASSVVRPSPSSNGVRPSPSLNGVRPSPSHVGPRPSPTGGGLLQRPGGGSGWGGNNYLDPYSYPPSGMMGMGIPPVGPPMGWDPRMQYSYGPGGPMQMPRPSPPPGMRTLEEPTVVGTVVNVGEDGSYGFSALEQVLKANPNIPFEGSASDLRNILADGLPSLWDQFFEIPELRSVVNGQVYESLNQKIADIRRAETWLGDTLGEMELYAIASLFNVRVRIAFQDAGGMVPGSGGGGGLSQAGMPRMTGDYGTASLTSRVWPGRVQAPIMREILPLDALRDPSSTGPLPTVYLLLSGRRYLPIIPGNGQQ